jgi:cob(I)alamin adenosyltransferase
MRIYTRTGDKGSSSLYSGERVSKGHLVFRVLGELDRLNCDLGFIRSYNSKLECISGIKPIQDLLIKIGSCIGTRPSNEKRYMATRLNELDSEVKSLESYIDMWSERLPPLTTFLTPGESEHSTRVHVARVSCRGLERVLIALCEDTENEIKDIQQSIDDAKRLCNMGNIEDVQNEITDLVKLYEDTVTLLEDLREIARYINRLSDYLFTLARYIEEKIEKEISNWEWTNYFFS